MTPPGVPEAAAVPQVDPPGARPTESDLQTILQRRADSLGIPLAELRAHDRAVLRASRAGRIACLDAFEIEELFSGELPPERAEHVAQCPMCAALVDVSRPSEEGFNRLMRAVAAEARLSLPADPQKTVGQALKELGLIEAGVLAVLAVAGAALLAFGRGTITPALLRLIAPDTIKVILAMAIGAAVVALIATAWLPPLIPGVRRNGGRVIGGVFATAAVCYAVVIGWSLGTAPSSLVQTIANQVASGPVNPGSVIAMHLPLSGSSRLVAQKTKDDFQVYWEDADKSHPLGTAYIGTLAHGSEGALKLLTAGRNVGLKQTGVVRAASAGQKGVAVVSADAPRELAASFAVVGGVR